MGAGYDTPSGLRGHLGLGGLTLRDDVNHGRGRNPLYRPIPRRASFGSSGRSHHFSPGLYGR